MTYTNREAAERDLNRATRRSFLTGALAAGVLAGAASIAAGSGLRRRVLEANERLTRRLYSTAHLAPAYPPGAEGELRANGDIGLEEELDPALWRLLVTAGGETRALTLETIARLPRVALRTEFRCVEGWSTVASWSGFRLADLAASLGLAQPPYVAAATPDEAYYVGLDGESAWHPQTLLADRRNGEPLTAEHGAPLRLVVPVKYGIKSLKRIGSLRFVDSRPADYWAERGYDWYAGL